MQNKEKKMSIRTVIFRTEKMGVTVPWARVLANQSSVASGGMFHFTLPGAVGGLLWCGGGGGGGSPGGGGGLIGHDVTFKYPSIYISWINISNTANRRVFINKCLSTSMQVYDVGYQVLLDSWICFSQESTASNDVMSPSLPLRPRARGGHEQRRWWWWWWSGSLTPRIENI